MEPNVHFWMTQCQSFFQRCLQWTELLDPTNLFISISKIEKSRQLLLTNEDGSIHDLQDKRIQEAWKRSLATVHPDSSKLIPSFFRPAALLPFTAPMVFLSLVPVKSLKSIVLPQLSFCTYSTAFNVVNGNASYNRRPYESILLGTGVIASTAFFGAVSDTATSRVVLFGTSAFIPEVFSHFFKKYSAVNSNRKFSLQQKKQNSSITEGCRGEFRVHLFDPCLETFLSKFQFRELCQRSPGNPAVSADRMASSHTCQDLIEAGRAWASSLGGRRDAGSCPV
ncbi:sideroflexin-4 isoform X3 [Myotis myotis]|uniref:sideroflexin-4 isoform X3 n=1 Tax=Myotis myotis TaxID=51298 RepID=UPI00174B4B2E|nr:sideroflexin-4 isoform X3 [Myotis myotis]